MSDLQRIVDGFDAGELVRPFAGSTSLVDLVRATAKACGVDDVPMTDASRAIADHLKRTEHLIFILADGLGIQYIDQLPRGSWLRRHTRRSILAPFPATTPVALTTVATGEYPACHGITGWWTHVPSLNAPVTVFHNARATDEISLDTLGVPFEEVFPRPTLIARMQRDVALFMPTNLVDTPFTRYTAAGRPCVGYGKHAEAARKIAERIFDAPGPTYTYWYTPYPDAHAHEHGAHDPFTFRSVEVLEEAIAHLMALFRERDVHARIVVTADHGHLDVGGAGHLEVTADDPLLQYLACPPSGDVRTQFWHVLPERRHEFKQAFKARFGEWFLLLNSTDVEVLGLLGPGLLSEETRARIGDFTSIALGREVLRYTGAPGREKYLAQRSHHSGLSAAEMHIPLIIIPTEVAQPQRELDFTSRRRG